MNEVWRTRLISSSNVNVASLVKIWRSGQNRIRVPVTPFLTRPPLCRPDCGVNGASGPSPAKTPGAPRWKLIAWVAGERSTSTSSRADSALTTEDADAVEAAGGDVRAAAELAAGVELGEDHLDAREPGLGLLVDRDAAPVVADLGGPVGVQRHVDVGAVPAERLVDRVVDDLPQAVGQAAAVGGADVHPRALADRLQSLQHEEVVGVVRVVDRSCSVPGPCLLVQSIRRHRHERLTTRPRHVGGAPPAFPKGDRASSLTSRFGSWGDFVRKLRRRFGLGRHTGGPARAGSVGGWWGGSRRSIRWTPSLGELLTVIGC